MVPTVPADGGSHGGAGPGKQDGSVCQGTPVKRMKQDLFSRKCSSTAIATILLQIEAENFPEISLKYEVVAVPTFIFLKVIVAIE